jgi:hypothetical protein
MNKTVILLIILAALIGYYFYHESRVQDRQSTANTGAPLREHVVPDLRTRDKDVRAIHVREKDKQVHLPLVNGVWTVAERSGYPASFSKIERTVQHMADMAVKGRTVIKPSVLGEVKLLVPGEAEESQTGLYVEMLDEKGGKVAAIVAGETITSSGGASANSGNMFGGPGNLRYVRVIGADDKDTVWSAEDNFYEYATDPKDWIDKSFIDVQKVKTAEVTAPNAADSWKAERKDEASPFTLVNAPAGEELDTAKATLDSVLSAASINDVLPKDKVNETLMKDAFKAKLTTFEGFTYEITALGKKEGTDAYVTVKVSADIPKERKAPADEKPDDKKKNDAEFEAKKKASEEKLAKEKGYEGWVFEVPGYNMNVLLKKRSEVLRDKQAPPAPGPEAGSGGTPRTGPILSPTPFVPGTIVTPPGTQAPAPPPSTPVAPPSTPAPMPNASPAPGSKPTEAATPPVEARPPTAPKQPAPDAKPPTAPKAPEAPKAPAAPKTEPEAPKAPATPPAEPKAPEAPKAPSEPKAP